MEIILKGNRLYHMIATKIYVLYVIVITQDEYDIFVITESKAKPRMSVNNKDILRVYCDITGFFPT